MPIEPDKRRGPDRRHTQVVQDDCGPERRQWARRDEDSPSRGWFSRFVGSLKREPEGQGRGER